MGGPNAISSLRDEVTEESRWKKQKMLEIASKILLASRFRVVVTLVGISALFFLSAAQIGLLVGWCNTTSAILRHTDADLWVMARETTTFDYGTPIPEHRAYQVQNVAGVQHTEQMYLGWTIWQCPDGRRVNVELVGLDDRCNGAPWKMAKGDAIDVLRPDAVIVDELFLKDLGVTTVGDDIEIAGRRAVVTGISRDVRSFTAAPFVFTSIESARRFSPHYSLDEITYVLVKCQPGIDPVSVRDRIQQQVPHVDCMTKQDFIIRTVKYWMLETGAGLTVICTAVLGFAVSTVVTSQTLYSITQDHLDHYATLLAVGFRRIRLVGIVLGQSAMLACLAAIISSCVYFLMASQLSDSPVRMETTALIYSLIVAVSILGCIAGSIFSIRSVMHIDPVEVFRA